MLKTDATSGEGVGASTKTRSDLAPRGFVRLASRLGCLTKEVLLRSVDFQVLAETRAIDLLPFV